MRENTKTRREEEKNSKQRDKIEKRKKGLIRRLVASFMSGQPLEHRSLWQPNFGRLVRNAVDLPAYNQKPRQNKY
jgi:hypothetical protein